MAQALCELQSELIHHDTSISDFYKAIRKGAKRKKIGDITRLVNKGTGSVEGNFPTSRELANLNEDFLKNRCNLGYRAKIILNLAKNVENGRLKLNQIEEASYMEVTNKLKKIKGFGPFASANVLMCLGFYQKVPADTETIRLFQKV